MYRIAVIQNMSEMLRYGWADIRPSLQGFDYEVENYTSGNIQDLFPKLEKDVYDGLIFATNACNDSAIHSALLTNKHTLESYLNRGHGILLLFQKRLTELEKSPSYEFLPETFQVNGVMKPETHLKGDLYVQPEASNHPILNHPNAIRMAVTKNYCLSNERIKCLYRGFIRPLNQTSYDTLVSDESYGRRRQIIICSKQIFSPRIVIASMVLDWQDEKELLQNCITYVVEGSPTVGVLKKIGESSSDFSYLLTNLGVYKIPHRVYSQKELHFEKRMFELHYSLFLDPAWSIEELRQSNIQRFADYLREGSKIVFWDKAGSPTAILGFLGGTRFSRKMIDNSLAWIASEYKDGQWAGSFWITFDILETLQYFEKPISQYKKEILARISPHDIHGSYDELLGATCALLKVYFWLLGKDSKKYQKTLAWIKKTLKKSSLFFEQATAIDTLKELGEDIDQQVMNNFVVKVLSKINNLTNEFQLFRYAETLYSCGLYDDAVKVALRLSSCQDENGCWMNVHETAAIATMLMRLQYKLPNHSPVIEKMIFGAIKYLQETYNPRNNNWMSNVAFTAKALVALKEFQNQISLPVEEFITSLKETRRFMQDSAQLEAATQLIAKLQEQNLSLANLLKNWQKEHKYEKLISDIIIITFVPVAAFVILILYFASTQDDLPAFQLYLATFWSKFGSQMMVVITIAIVSGFLYILRNIKPIRWILDRLTKEEQKQK